MIPSSYGKLIHRASQALQRHGAETNRNAVVKEVKEEGGERKVRCIIGVRPDGSEWLSPWMSTQEQRSGQERSQSAIKPGQNGVIQGSARQGTFSAQGESTEHAPQPKHAPQINGPSSSVGKKLRSAMHGGQDDQQQGGGGQSGGSGGQSGGGGQQQEKEHYWSNYIAKEDEKLDQWTPQTGKANSTTTGHGGGTTSSQSKSSQQGQQDQQQKEEKALAVTMHETMGHTAKVGDGDSAVRYAAHEKGAKIRAGKDNYFVSEKDKKNYVRASIDNYVHAVGGQNYVNKPWVIKDSPEDPVPNHNEAEEPAMVAVSNRIKYAVQQAGRPPDPLIEYEVLDPMHEPDLNGELAGGKVYTKSGKQFVKLTEDQARFYLDSASIAPVQKPDAQAQSAPKK